MSSDDQFTSIQWDREDDTTVGQRSHQEPIIEEEILESTSADDGEVPKSSTTNDRDDGQHEAFSDNITDSGIDDDPSNSLLLSGKEVKDAGGRSNDSPIDNEIRGDQQPENDIKKASSDALLDRKKAETDRHQQDQAHQEEAERLFDLYTIQSTVSKPELNKSSKPFITYLVTTITNNPSVKKLNSEGSDTNNGDSSDDVTITVRRRYDDFRCLHECLINDYPQYLVPPLPSKLNLKYLKGDTLSAEFVHKRLNSLSRFIRYVVQHKALSQSSVFHLFISNSQDWSTFVKNLKVNRIDGDDSPGIVNRVVNEDLTETVMNFLTPSKHKKETNKDILEINDRLKKLYENLIKLDKIFSRLNKRNSDLKADYDLFLAQIAKLVNVQRETNSEMEATDKGGIFEGSEETTDQTIDEAQTSDSKKDSHSETNDEENQASDKASNHESSSMINNFKIFSESLSYFLQSWGGLHMYIDESFLVSLKDCSRYIIGLTHLIEFQHNKRIDLQVLQDYLGKARSELLALNGSGPSRSAPPNPVMNNHTGGLVNNTTQIIKDTISTSATSHIGSSATESKVAKTESKINQLENEIELQTKLVNDLTYKVINEEYPAWDRFNKNELKGSMLGLCDEQIKLYSGLISNWNDVEKKLSKRLNDLST